MISDAVRRLGGNHKDCRVFRFVVAFDMIRRKWTLRLVLRSTVRAIADSSKYNVASLSNLGDQFGHRILREAVLYVVPYVTKLNCLAERDGGRANSIKVRWDIPASRSGASFKERIAANVGRVIYPDRDEAAMREALPFAVCQP